jgi:hypothetical protein
VSSAQAILDEMSQRGVTARVDGKTLRLKPREALDDDLLSRIKEHKPEIIRVLATIPPMPEGVRLVHWELKPAPVILTRCEVVTEVSRFIELTFLELRAAMAGKPYLSGHRSVRELVDRLEECGVVVEVNEPSLVNSGNRER